MSEVLVIEVRLSTMHQKSTHESALLINFDILQREREFAACLSKVDIFIQCVRSRNYPSEV